MKTTFQSVILLSALLITIPVLAAGPRYVKMDANSLSRMLWIVQADMGSGQLVHRQGPLGHFGDLALAGYQIIDARAFNDNGFCFIEFRLNTKDSPETREQLSFITSKRNSDAPSAQFCNTAQ